MTERDEIAALADRINQAGTIEIVDADLIDRNFSSDERDLIVKALRSAARTGAGYGAGFEACREAAISAQPCTAENPNEDAYQRGKFDGVMEYAKAIVALPAPATVSAPEPASEQEAESAIRHLRIVIDAAENSNQAGENAVVRAAMVTGWKRP